MTPRKAGDASPFTSQVEFTMTHRCVPSIMKSCLLLVNKFDFCQAIYNFKQNVFDICCLLAPKLYRMFFCNVAISCTALIELVLKFFPGSYNNFRMK